MSNFYQRGHQKQQDSYGGGGASSSWNLPPLSLPGTLALHLGFAIKGAQDAMNLRVAGEKIQLDRVSPPFLLSSDASLLAPKPVVTKGDDLMSLSDVERLTIGPEPCRSCKPTSSSRARCKGSSSFRRSSSNRSSAAQWGSEQTTPSRPPSSTSVSM